MSPGQSDNTGTVAGFWRRIIAFTLDCLLIGTIGAAAGFVLVDEFALLGPWGRLVGFFVALVYFGSLNSRLSGGQTLGKRLLKIKVVKRDGSPLCLTSSFLRFLPLGAAWFLNNAKFSDSVLMSPWIYALSVAIFGIGLSIVYLCIFNRATRQSVHDIMVGSYVVSAAAAGQVAAAKLARLHLGVCIALVVAAGVTPYFTNRLAASEPLLTLLKIQRSVAAEPWVVRAEVWQETSINLTDQGQSNTRLSITAFLKDSDTENAERAKQLANLALSLDSSTHTLSIIQVTLVYGYDIGIASSWHGHNHAYPPEEWLAAYSEPSRPVNPTEGGQ